MFPVLNLKSSKSVHFGKNLHFYLNIYEFGKSQSFAEFEFNYLEW